jgi:hypothetical protein
LLPPAEVAGEGGVGQQLALGLQPGAHYHPDEGASNNSEVGCPPPRHPTPYTPGAAPVPYYGSSSSQVPNVVPPCQAGATEISPGNVPVREADTFSFNMAPGPSRPMIRNFPPWAYLLSRQITPFR